MDDKLLLSIVELGGYRHFGALYERFGYQVETVNSQRKARNWLKKNNPDVILAEFNYQTDFRDRTSNLETLMAVLQKKRAVKVIILYQQEHKLKLDILTERFPVFACLPFPVAEQDIAECLEQLNASA